MSENLDLLFLIEEKEKFRRGQSQRSTPGGTQKHSDLIDRVLGGDTDTAPSAAGKDNLILPEEVLPEGRQSDPPASVKDTPATALPALGDENVDAEDGTPAPDESADLLQLPLDISDSVDFEDEAQPGAAAPDDAAAVGPETDPDHDEEFNIQEASGRVESEIDAVLAELRQSLLEVDEIPDTVEFTLDPTDVSEADTIDPETGPGVELGTEFSLDAADEPETTEAKAIFRDGIGLSDATEQGPSEDRLVLSSETSEKEAVKALDSLLEVVDEAEADTEETDSVLPAEQEQAEDSAAVKSEAPPLQLEETIARQSQPSDADADQGTPFRGSASEGRKDKGKPKEKARPAKKARARSNFLSFSLKPLFENPQPLGLDISSRAVKYVQFEKSGRGLKLVNCGRASIPDITFDAGKEEKQGKLSAYLGDWFKAGKFKKALFSTCVSGLEVWFNHIRVPKMADRDLAKAVPWACRKDLPFPLEATTLEFARTGQSNATSDDKIAVFVVAVQQEVVNDHLDVLDNAGIAPVKVSTVPVALWHTFRFCVRDYSDKCYAIVDIGSDSSHIVFVNDGELQFAREISTASSDFTEALTSPVFIDGREIEHDSVSAERVKRKHGIPQPQDDSVTADGVPLREVSVLMVPVLERLVRDIQRTFDFYKEKFHVSEIEQAMLSGGGALMPNLGEWLSKELATPVALLNPLQECSLGKFSDADSLRKLGPRFAVAAGLALDQSDEFNLMPGHLKTSQTTVLTKRILRYAFVILLLLMTFLYQDVSREVKKVSAEFVRVSSEFEQSEPVRQRYLASQRILQDLTHLKSNYNNSLAVNHQATQHLKVIGNYFPSKLTLSFLRIEKRNVSDKEGETTADKEFLIMEGVAFEDNSLEGLNLAKFLLELEGSDYFKGVALAKQSVREDGALQFTIECENYLK